MSLNAPIAATRVDYGRLFPLYASQALATGATTVSTILASLIMSNLGSESLSGLPSTIISIAAALSASLFGALMIARGRRLGLLLAFMLGALGALLGFAAAHLHLTSLFLLGAAMMGAAQGGYQQARYAVTESVPEDRRGTALGALMLMSVVGSFVMTGASKPIERLSMVLHTTPEITGWLVGGSLLAVAALFIFAWQPIAPAQVAPAQAKAKTAQDWNIFKTSGVKSTMLAVAVAQGLMVTLMSLTPLRAHHMGIDHAGIAALISGHILGMFGFGWLTGPLIDRLGLRFGYVVGAVLLVAAALTATLSGGLWLGMSMFLLGLGWNLAFVSGSKSLTHFPAAQGIADGLGYVSAAFGTFFGGLLIASQGFSALAYVCAALALLLFVSAWRVRS